MSSTAFGAELATLSDARKLSDKAIALFQKEQIDAGYATLQPYWPLNAVEIQNLANQTTTQWPMIKGRFGPSISTEFISESKVGESLARFVYLQKFKNHAIRWVFIFYKPEEKWVINSFSFDDQLHQQFEK